MKKVIVSVTNDLVTDRRVDKTCQTLLKSGFDVTLAGRRKTDSLTLEKRNYRTHRFRLLFEKGPFFYAEYNIRLFFYLLSQKVQLLVSNDLDTLLPNFLVSKLKRIPLVYDSHEYYTQTPELVHRKRVQQVWKRIEKWIFPRLTDIITVNESIAGLYRNEYKKKIKVIRNIPPQLKPVVLKSKQELGIPENKKIILLQGAGINMQRGAEEAVEAMQYVENAILLIIGGGDVIEKLKEQVQKLKLQDKVLFIPKQPLDSLIHYTLHADIGLTLDKDTNINYRFSLPNKLFDYIHAGVPVLASRLPEIEKIISNYHIGTFIENHEPTHIAEKINFMLTNTEEYQRWKNNLPKAAHNLNWEEEEKIAMEIYAKYK
ncbi:MAG: glycosyltransferase [Lentimicrobiaceae bacterium]|nr:glycosyltransferase [Lentimicrobiaceae bacterium]